MSHAPVVCQTRAVGFRSNRGVGGRAVWVSVTVVACAAVIPGRALAQRDTLYWRLADRGPGVPTSMFGTSVSARELLLYPFFEYYHDRNAEYSPEELGYGLDQDFRGKYRASEGLIFLGYGVSDRLALELEAAVITAQQDKAPEDPSNMPAQLKESGLGDVESEIRWRWNHESDRSPEVFSYFETTFPLQKAKKLIGTPDWEFKLGTGVVRGFRWGTTTARVSVAYDEGSLALGETAVEYLKRVSPTVRLFAGVEAEQDEVELITEAQWFLRPNLFLKLNNSFGMSSKATDWAPEIGLMFSFR